MKDEFKMGDKVWSFSHRKWGEVVEVVNADDYPIKVDFAKAIIYVFTEKGFSIAGVRDLFFEEIPIPESALKRPFKPEPGSLYVFSSPDRKIGSCKSIFHSINDGCFVNANGIYYTHCRELTLDEWAEIGAPISKIEK